MTTEQRRSIEQLNDQLLGQLANSRVTSAADRLAAEIGIPVPAWFNVREPTVSDVNMVGLELRRSR